jgi:hypothetical protein
LTSGNGAPVGTRPVARTRCSTSIRSTRLSTGSGSRDKFPTSPRLAPREIPLAAREHSGSNLTARGFGSVTFRPAASQLVKTKQHWSDGAWSIVLVRPLSVAADDGITLKPGQKYSVAFAVWNGAQRDRAGQKLISIWNDLHVE